MVVGIDWTGSFKLQRRLVASLICLSKVTGLSAA